MDFYEFIIMGHLQKALKWTQKKYGMFDLLIFGISYLSLRVNRFTRTRDSRTGDSHQTYKQEALKRRTSLVGAFTFLNLDYNS